MILSDEPRFSRLAAQPPSRELPATDQPLGLDEELMAYYDAEALGGHRVEHGEMRHGLRERFRDLLRAETSTSARPAR